MGMGTYLPALIEVLITVNQFMLSRIEIYRRWSRRFRI